MEKLLLGFRPLGQELNIIHQQNIYGTIVLGEIRHGAMLNRPNHVFHESLRIHISDLQIRVPLGDGIANRMHQVCLAQTDTPVQQQRVVGCPAHIPGHL